MSRGTSLLAALVATVAGLGLSAPPASASVDPGHDVPDDATITIRGDGSGHGTGMSQYGAYGAALDGLGHRQILDFYYPGTQTGRAGGAVKVWITGDDDRDLVVDARDGLRVTRVGGRSWRPREPRARQWRVRPDRRGDHVVGFRTRSGGWRTWKVVRGDVELSAGGAPLTLRTPDGPVRYRGRLRSVDYRSEQRLTVNVVPLEHYLRGVVPAEMQAGWPQQALRAQAVAARTYAVHERGDGNTYYDLCDTAACQAYGGRTAEASATTRAVTATASDVLTWGGEPAFAMYSASNGGHTVAGPHGEPYLPAQPDSHEGTSPDYYDWRRTVTTRAFERAFGLGNLTYVRVEGRDGQGPRGGRVTAVRMRTEGGFDEPVDGEKVRRNLGLPSSLFEITRVD